MNATTKTESGPARRGVLREPGRLCLRVVGGEEAAIDLVRGPTVVVGRGEHADVQLAYETMSKRHFSLRVEDGHVELRDLGSKNGVTYAGRRIQQMQLHPGDRFSAGDVEIELVQVVHLEVEVENEALCGHLLGKSDAMRRVFARLRKLGPSRLDILIEGETGTGKELTARTLHDLSGRSPFVVLDCAGLPTTLADAAIFGVAKGAYTGAERERAGLFEQADGGTLFIDEFGELPSELQVKFLRALDQRQVTRLGEHGQTRSFDVRVIAATNRDLYADAEAGRFRSDLLMRTAQSRLELPPLREREDDILFLARLFLEQCADEDDAGPLELAAATVAALHLYEWPGNVRELRNAMREAAVFASGGVVQPSDVQLGRAGWKAKLARTAGDVLKYDDWHAQMDRVFLPVALEEAGSLREAERRLGIGYRRLLKILEAAGLDPEAYRRS